MLIQLPLEVVPCCSSGTNPLVFTFNAIIPCDIFRSGLFVVGPESAGAHPGPACYKKGGPLTVTDANLVLGRLLPEYFPKIFGPNEDSPLDHEASSIKFNKITEDVNKFLAEQESSAKVRF